MFLAPSDYITLVYNFRWSLSQPITFVNRSKHEFINVFRAGSGKHYPIGILGDAIELQFLHYESESQATEKWYRRVDRVSRDDSKIFFQVL